MSDGPWNRCFYTFNWLLAGWLYHLRGGRMKFLDLTIKMLSMSAVRRLLRAFNVLTLSKVRTQKQDLKI